MPFTLVKNNLGDYDLFINGFYMPDFSIKRDYFKLQQWDDKGKVEIWDFENFTKSDSKSDDENLKDIELLQAISKIIKGENDDSGSNFE